MSFPILTTMMIVPLVGALAIWFLVPVRTIARPFAFVVSLITLGLGVMAYLEFDTAAAGTHQLVEMAEWIPALGVSYALGVDGVGLLLVLLSVILVPVVILAAWKEHRERIHHYMALILLLEVFMVGIFAARDVFLFYVFFEAMLIPVYFMIGGFGGAQRRYAAVKFLLFSLAGGLIMLVGLIVLGFAGPGGPQNFLIDTLTQVSLDPNTEMAIFLSFFLAFAVKAPMFPVHTWLPDAAEQAPAGTSVLLVGVLDKVGTFGMLTLCLPLFPNASAAAAPTICVFAVISIIYGALLAIGQRDLMRLIAYTSVSHFGFIVLGIFAFSTTSTAGASFYMFNHGLSTGALFLLAGFLFLRKGGTQTIEEYVGLIKPTPVLYGTFLTVGLATLSLPGLSPFISEFLVVIGAFTTQPVLSLIGIIGVVLAAIYILLTVQKIFTGQVSPELADAKDLSARERWVVAPLIALMLGLGFYPKPALDLVRPPAEVTVEQISQTGVTVGASSLPSDEGSVL